MSLIELVSDYMKSEKLRRQYSLKPKAVLADYGVKGPLLKALQDPEQGLAAAVALELGELANKGIGGVHPLGWGIAAMVITGFSPSDAPPNVEFVLTIDGEQLRPDAQAAVIRGEHKRQNIILATNTQYISPKQIKGTFTLKPGAYEVAAIVLPKNGGPPIGSWLDDGDVLNVGGVGPSAKKKAKKPGKEKKKEKAAEKKPKKPKKA
jgi:hypothetical protein